MLPATSVSTLLIRSAASVWLDQRSVPKVPQLSVAQVSRQRRLCDKHQALYPQTCCLPSPSALRYPRSAASVWLDRVPDKISTWPRPMAMPWPISHHGRCAYLEMSNTILKECSMQYGYKMPDCKLWHFQQYLFGARRCPAGANRRKFLHNPARVKSILKMCSPIPPIFNWKLYCGFIHCDFPLTCANSLPYWCFLVQIFYRTGAPCRDQWRT